MRVSAFQATPQQVRLGRRDVGVHYLLWFSEFGQLSARFLKQ